MQIAVADIDGDGALELLALDARGSAALFSSHGKLIWDIHTGGAASASATFGDIDGDGRLDATWGTATGEVHAVVAISGALSPKVPATPPQGRLLTRRGIFRLPLGHALVCVCSIRTHKDDEHVLALTCS